ncbi:multicopper oxidase family protein [Paenibacillus arenilitoris]|uniref:Multicopper oxidase family protein n=1 Tax=Paenibacillus arenilitoris TaxID=2772299 RepID=A0A927CST9_9BACL|nr:multicopper oxidase family protein [Paenibacillus arenilitoris]MBD2870955.1 multicopper oxidase family protein [Paenibacillus arenilitoris]
MAETIIGLILTAAMALLWGLAGLAATGLPYAKNARRLKRAASFLLAMSYITLILCALWYATIAILMVRSGWLFAEGTVKAVVPFTLVSAGCVAAATVPRLRSLRKSGTEEPLSQETIVQAAHPAVALPYYSAALASGMAAFSPIFAQAVLPDLSDIMNRLLLLALLLLVPALLIRRRHLLVRRGEKRRTGLGIRLWNAIVAAVLTSLIGIAIIVANVITGSLASRLPEASDMMNHEHVDEGGGSPTLMSGLRGHAHVHHAVQRDGGASTIEVSALTGNLSAPADVKFELVARRQQLTLASGAKISAWAYNGEIAPELRVRQGDMVEVKLVNKDIDNGVTIHWHGYNVPNAMDGVPGITQDVVKPGQSFVYKFRAEQEGSYWFHSHQQASEQVARGLFGSLIVEPANKDKSYDEELTVIQHRWETDQGHRHAFGTEDGMQYEQMKPGTKVKLRVINTHNLSQNYILQGADYRIAAIDGVRIREPGLLPDGTAFRLGSGARHDVVFTMPDHPVMLRTGDSNNGKKDLAIVLYSGARPEAPSFEAASGQFDPSRYGRPAENEETSAAAFDREFEMILGNRMGFYNGKFHFLWTVNGEVHPNTPTFVVKEGELIKTTFVNKSLAEHPMHLHGHHMTVLKKNGKKVETPWLADTLNVHPGESYEVAFKANNPGMWMDHCHNLDHAATGMILHLMYDHVRPSYEAGTRSGNLPD